MSRSDRGGDQKKPGGQPLCSQAARNFSYSSRKSRSNTKNCQIKMETEAREWRNVLELSLTAFPDRYLLLPVNPASMIAIASKSSRGAGGAARPADESRSAALRSAL